MCYVLQTESKSKDFLQPIKLQEEEYVLTFVFVFVCVKAAGQMQVAVSGTDLLVISTHMITTGAAGITSNTSIVSDTTMVP